MNKINKITAGIDWEILVHNGRTGYSAGKKKIAEIIDLAYSKSPEFGIGDDLDLLEIRIGVAHSYNELHNKIFKAFELCKKIASRKNLVLVPLGYRETDMNPAGGHIHAGSIEYFADAAKLHNRLISYVPAFIALSSSSPSLDGEYKSYRINQNARFCSVPASAVKTNTVTIPWGDDICIKYPYKSTLELRAGDSLPTANLMTELAALYVGLVVKTSHFKKSQIKFDPVEYGINRINASRHGMQATFVIDGKEITAADFISKHIIPFAIDGLKTFGIPDDEFHFLREMVKKHISVADWVREMIPIGTDAWRATGEITRIFATNPDIEGWIHSTKSRKIAHIESFENLLMNSIAIDTPLENIYDAIPLPFAYIENELRKLVENSKIIKKFGAKNKVLFDRTDLL
ncbi:hypothetical protein J7L68_02940 [bacterium]|nr:hypothetical protein [bacterium]